MKNPGKQIRRTEAEVRALLNLYSKKNGTVAEFCKIHKIHKATFYNWRNQYELQMEKPARFIPVNFTPADAQPTVFAEIEFTSKVTVRLFQQVEAAYFKALLK